MQIEPGKFPFVQLPEHYRPDQEPWCPLRLDLQRHNYPGKLIVFEGIDGSGKTTLINALSSYLKDRGQDHIIIKTPSEDLRATWVWKAYFDQTLGISRDEVNVFGLSIMAFGDRLVHQSYVTEPALRAGKWVLCDRYIMASATFQSDLVHQLLTRLLVRPNLGVVVDVDLGEALRRLKARKCEVLHPLDEDRHRLTRERLRLLAALNDFVVISTSRSTVEDSFRELKDKVDSLLG